MLIPGSICSRVCFKFMVLACEQRGRFEPNSVDGYRSPFSRSI